MTLWTRDELNPVGAASELQIAVQARAGSPSAAHILE